MLYMNPQQDASPLTRRSCFAPEDAHHNVPAIREVQRECPECVAEAASEHQRSILPDQDEEMGEIPVWKRKVLQQWTAPPRGYD